VDEIVYFPPEFSSLILYEALAFWQEEDEKGSAEGTS
jgi:hypothetical protein